MIFDLRHLRRYKLRYKADFSRQTSTHESCMMRLKKRTRDGIKTNPLLAVDGHPSRRGRVTSRGGVFLPESSPQCGLRERRGGWDQRDRLEHAEGNPQVRNERSRATRTGGDVRRKIPHHIEQKHKGWRGLQYAGPALASTNSYRRKPRIRQDQSRR